MKPIAIVAALLTASAAFAQTVPPWQQAQGLLGIICSGNEHVDAETAGVGFCTQDPEAQRRLLNRMAVLNLMAGSRDRVWVRLPQQAQRVLRGRPQPRWLEGVH